MNSYPKLNYCALSLLFFYLMLTQLQGQEVEIINERKLDLGLYEFILLENQLSVNPYDDKHLLLSGMYLNPKKADVTSCFGMISTDEGKNWNKIITTSGKYTGDPWGVITNKGTAIFTALSSLASDELTLEIHRFQKGDSKWSNSPMILKGSFDHQTAVVDRNDNTIYVVAILGDQVYVNYSEDDGLSFNHPHTIQFNNLGTNTMVPVVQEDGTLTVSFTNFNRPVINGTRKGRSREFLAKTISWITNFTKDEGFSNPMLISTDCEKGFPVLAIDHSKENTSQNMYYVCSSQTDNTIYNFYSNTNGKSWSLPIAVAKFNNLNEVKRNPFVGIPQIEINNTGILGVLWQSRLDDPENKCNTLYFSASLDGGKTFIKPTKVSSKESCMENPQNMWAGSRYKSGGDYMSFISLANGDFMTIWADSREGRATYYTAQIRVKQF
ncbi:MAG: hypothetical protein AAFO07_07080 [Bacteroidota bacterium]